MYDVKDITQEISTRSSCDFIQQKQRVLAAPCHIVSSRGVVNSSASEKFLLIIT